MAPPNTSDIFFNLNEFLAQNEGPYKEIHRELEKQGKLSTMLPMKKRERLLLMPTQYRRRKKKG